MSSGYSVCTTSPGGRSATDCAGESAADREHDPDRSGGRLRVVQLGEGDDVGVALLDPVAPGDPDVEHAVGDVARDLLRAQDAHLVDAGVVDAAAVVDVGAARRPRGRRPRTAAWWRVRASPWGGRGGASARLSRCGCGGKLPEQVDHLDRGDRGLLALVARDAVARRTAAAGQRLVEVVGGEHAEHDGHAGVERDPRDARPRTPPPRSRSAGCRPGSPRRGRSPRRTRRTPRGVARPAGSRTRRAPSAPGRRRGRRRAACRARRRAAAW